MIHQQQPNNKKNNRRLPTGRSMHHRNGWIPKQLPCWNTVHQTHSLGNRSTTNICTTSTDWLLHNETLTSRKRNRRRPTINLQQGKYTLHCCHRNGNKTKTNCALLPSQRKQNKDKLCWLSDPAVAKIITFGIDLAKMMLSKVPSANQKQKYHVFISFAGEVRKEREFDYVTILEDQLQIAAGGGNILNIFVAEKTMHAGQQSDPLVTMLTNALTARVVACVASTHYVQKKWCIAELLCALARNETVCPWTGVSRVIVDAFPGCHWVLPSCRATASVSLPDTSKNQTDVPINRSTKKWLDDFCCLFPTRLPTMKICEITGENVYGKCCSANFGRNNSCVTS